MAMGSTSKVVISDEMQKAKTECQNFRSQVKTFAQELDTSITTLLCSVFQGDAAVGFKEFYDKNIKAFFDDGGTFDQYLAMFDKEGDGLFDSIEKTLIGGEGLDPSLGENNRNVGQTSDEQAAQ